MKSTSISPTRLEYDKFLEAYIASKQANIDTENPTLTSQFLEKRTYIRPETIKNWQYPSELSKEDRGIYEDIFRKFNNHNKFGIGQTWATNEPGTMASYSFAGDMENPQSTEDYSYLSHPPLNNKKSSYTPEAKTIAHEVVHANDHQIDHLTPKIWRDLKELYDKNKGQFDTSINKLRNKIDPDVFGISAAYHPNTVKQTMNEELNQFRRELPNGKFYKNIDLKDKSGDSYKDNYYDWQTGLPEMQKLVNLRTQRPWSGPGKSREPIEIPNYHFKGTFASEFPAFALTNLTKSWKTAEKTGKSKNLIEALNRDEQEFLYNMLGHANDAYPEKDNSDQDLYPTINRFINERRKSIEGTKTWQDAHKPNFPKFENNPSGSGNGSKLPSNKSDDEAEGGGGSGQGKQIVQRRSAGTNQQIGESKGRATTYGNQLQPSLQEFGTPYSRLKSQGMQPSQPYGHNQHRMMDNPSQLRLGGDSLLQRSGTPYSPPQLQPGSLRGVYGGNTLPMMGMQSGGNSPRAQLPQGNRVGQALFGARGDDNLVKRPPGSPLGPNFSGYNSPTKTRLFSGANPNRPQPSNPMLLQNQPSNQGQQPWTTNLTGDEMHYLKTLMPKGFALNSLSPLLGMMNPRGNQGSNSSQFRSGALSPGSNRSGGN